MNQPDSENSYKDIFKSTGIIGLSKVVIILIRLIRNKVVAVLLGSAGMGLQGLYTSNLEMVNTLAQFGFGFSGTKEIAAASVNENKERVSEMATIIQRWVIFMGIIGALITIFLSKKFSEWAFGDQSHTTAFIFLASTVLLTSVMNGQAIILQGLRRIKFLALSDILGTTIGVVLSIGFYWKWGIEGIVPAIIVMALSQLFSKWWYLRKIKLKKVAVTLQKTLQEGKSIMVFGSYIVLSNFIPLLALYLLKIIIANQLDMDAVGYFHAAWFFTTFYLQMILNAMSKDYFPRLNTKTENNAVFNQYINEQLEIALLLATPLIIGVLTFIQYLIPLLYSQEFVQATTLFQWMILASFFMVLNFPLGYAIAAKKYMKTYLSNAVVRFMILVLIPFFLLTKYNIDIIGVAYLGGLIVTQIIFIFQLKKASDYKFSKQNVFIAILSLTVICCVFILAKLFNHSYTLIVGILLTVCSIIFSYIKLSRIISFKQVFGKFL